MTSWILPQMCWQVGASQASADFNRTVCDRHIGDRESKRLAEGAGREGRWWPLDLFSTEVCHLGLRIQIIDEVTCEVVVWRIKHMSDDQGPSLSVMQSHLNFGFYLRVLPKVFVFSAFLGCTDKMWKRHIWCVYSLSRLPRQQPVPLITPALPCLSLGGWPPSLRWAEPALPVITNTSLYLISSYLLSLDGNKEKPLGTM